MNPVRKGAFRAQFRSLKLAEDGPFFAGMFEVDAKVFGKKRRRRDGIIVAEQNEFTVCGFHSRSACSAGPCIGLAQISQGVWKLQRKTEGFGVVGRPVVHDDYFPEGLGQSLKRQGGETDAKSLFAIEGRQNDGYFRRRLSCFRGNQVSKGGADVLRFERDEFTEFLFAALGGAGIVEGRVGCVHVQQETAVKTSSGHRAAESRKYVAELLERRGRPPGLQ